MGVRGDKPSTAPNALLSTKRDRAHFRTIATLIASAADALEYAHSMGVVHRDIKPGNLMLDTLSPLPVSGRGDGGEGCHLWITDFGLAKLASPGGDAGGALTLTGDLIGTLRYMSPEQALAKHGLVDHRTDIYSLGATLYELLTLKPAVPGNDKAEILKSIAWDEPTPLRKHDKSIPAELETITLKCLAKEPGERYTTAGEVTDDLRSWLGDKAIKAKPPGWRERTAKWAGRHKGLLASAALLTTIVLIGLTVAVFREQRIAQEASSERDRARNNLRLALDGLDVSAKHAIDSLTVRPMVRTPVETDMMRKMLSFYEEFASKNCDDAELRLETSKAHFRSAQIYSVLYDHAKAVEASRTALQFAEKFLAERPNDANAARQATICRANLGRTLFFATRHPEAEPVIRDAANAIGVLLAAAPSDRELLDLAYHMHNAIGMLAMMSAPARLAEAEAQFRQAAEIGERWVASSPHDARPPGTVTTTYHNLSRALELARRYDKALEVCRKAIVHQREAIRRDPRDPTWRLNLRHNLNRFVALQQALNRPFQEVVATIAEQVAVMERLVEEYPASQQYREYLALDLRSHVGVNQPAFDYKGALPLQQRSTALYESLIRDFPNNEKYRADRDNGLLVEAIILRNLKREADAVAVAARIDKRYQIEYSEAARLITLIRLTAEDKNLRDPAEALRLATWGAELPLTSDISDDKTNDGNTRRESWMFMQAWAHYRLGDFLAARDVLDRVPTTAESKKLERQYLRSLVLWKLGERGDARTLAMSAAQEKQQKRSNSVLDVLHGEVVTELGLTEADFEKPRP